MRHLRKRIYIIRPTIGTELISEWCYKVSKAVTDRFSTDWYRDLDPWTLDFSCAVWPCNQLIDCFESRFPFYCSFSFIPASEATRNSCSYSHVKQNKCLEVQLHSSLWSNPLCVFVFSRTGELIKVLGTFMSRAEKSFIRTWFEIFCSFSNMGIALNSLLVILRSFCHPRTDHLAFCSITYLCDVCGHNTSE